MEAPMTRSTALSELMTVSQSACTAAKTLLQDGIPETRPPHTPTLTSPPAPLAATTSTRPAFALVVSSVLSSVLFDAFAFVLALVVIYPVLIPYALLTWLYRAVCEVVAWCVWGMDKTPPPLQPLDSVWLQETEANHCVITSVYTCEPIDVETVRQCMADRLLSVEPRLTAIPRRACGRLRWVPDPHFDISQHIQELEYDSREHSFDGMVSRMCTQPMARDKPLWCLLLAQDKAGDGPEGKPRSHVILRLQHCMSDGLGIIYRIMENLLDSRRDDPEAAYHGAALKPAFTRSQLILSTFVGFFRAPGIILGLLMERAPRSWQDPRRPMEQVTGKKVVGRPLELPLEAFRPLRSKLTALIGTRVTLNDVLTCALVGAYRRYAVSHSQHGSPIVDRSMTLPVFVPVSLRTDEVHEMGNNMVPVPIRVPASPNDTLVQRLRSVHTAIQRLKSQTDMLVMALSLKVLADIVPPTLSHYLGDMLASKSAALFTNVPGPSDLGSLAGRKGSSCLCFAPMRGGCGIAIAMVSMAGGLRVNIVADQAVLPDPNRWTHFFMMEIQALARLAGVDVTDFAMTQGGGGEGKGERGELDSAVEEEISRVVSEPRMRHTARTGTPVSERRS
ncbi:unnamed protein product [Vitrella brassicaformis CCMP3155]|uniref:Uncharacterized protein n=1 Tax=Vitrella brassicaformis (strain CCMP3155) TaxID=1169540 RepID=A0A0G4GR14_VITBC|nr:unnamed protein product [Vitrella brassicaformis CCMP3155]|eukprot:CEM32787.1 unnamed protein product [Vitrella brassicaformis CCMP3155]